MPATKHNQAGSIMVAAIVIALITGALVGGLLKTITMEFEDSHRSRMSLQAVNLAEAGLEFARDAMNRGDWMGWTSGSKGYFRDDFPMTAHGGLDHATREVQVFVEPTGSPPAAVAEAVIRTLSGIEVRRQIYIQLGQRSLFGSGWVARNTVKFVGNNVYIDSYRSSHGAYHASLNSNDNGSVASLRVTSDAVLLGNGNVWGRVATGGSNPNIGPNGTVRGSDAPAGVKVD